MEFHSIPAIPTPNVSFLISPIYLPHFYLSINYSPLTLLTPRKQPTGKCGQQPYQIAPPKPSSSPNSQTGSMKHLPTELLPISTTPKQLSMSPSPTRIFHIQASSNTNEPLSFADGPFIARPVVGGHFALLALEGAPKSASGKRSTTQAQARKFVA